MAQLTAEQTAVSNYILRKTAHIYGANIRNPASRTLKRNGAQTHPEEHLQPVGRLLVAQLCEQFANGSYGG